MFKVASPNDIPSSTQSYKTPASKDSKVTSAHKAKSDDKIMDRVNGWVKYVEELPGKATDYTKQQGVQQAEKLFRDRYGAKQNVPMDKALSRLAQGDIVKEVLAGRYLPGVAKRDSSGNIMPSSYPYRTLGRRPHSDILRPGHEMGIKPGSEFEGPPQSSNLSQRSWDYAKKRIYDLKRYGSYAKDDLGYEQSNKSFNAPYMPKVVMDDLKGRNSKFGPSLGFTSQEEYDNHVKTLIDQEVRFRQGHFNDKNLQELKNSVGLGASLGLAPLLSAKAVQALTTGSGLLRAGSRTYDTYKDLKGNYMDSPPGFIGREQSASSLYNDIINSDKPETQDLRDKLKGGISQALYSGYESGDLSKVYNRLKGFLGTAKSTETEEADKGITESAEGLYRAMNDLGIGLHHARQDPKSPFNSLEGVKHLANSELFDRMTARQLRPGSQLNLKDYAALGRSALGTTKDVLVDYAKNNPVATAANVLPGVSAHLPRVSNTVKSLIASPSAAYQSNRQAQAEYDHSRRRVESGRPQGAAAQVATRAVGKRLIEGAPGLSQDILNDRVDQPGYLSSRLGIAANKLIDNIGASKVQDAQLASGYRPNAFPDRDARGQRYYSVAKELLSDTGRGVAEMGSIVNPISKGVTAYRVAKPFVQPSQTSQTPADTSEAR